MRKAMVRVEQRLDATIAVRFQDQYVRVRRCAQPIRELQPPLQAVAAKPPKPAGKPKRKPDWMNNFSLQSGPSLRVKRTFLLCLDRQPNAKRPEWLD